MGTLVDIKKVEVTVVFEEGGKPVTATQTWDDDEDLADVIADDEMLGQTVRRLVKESSPEEDEG